MRAMLLEGPRRPLREAVVQTPKPGPGELLIQVRACGVCRTDLHVADGELPNPKLPLVLGHEIVGTVADVGARVDRFAPGDRVGVPWLGWTCGECRFCRTARENLCERARFTGYQIDGGYAEYTVADARYCFALPRGYDDAEAAPLLCAGLIGYRALVAAGDAERLGLYGFGAAAHLVAQVARHEGRRIFAFTRPGDTDGQRFAHDRGAVPVGSGERRARAAAERAHARRRRAAPSRHGLTAWRSGAARRRSRRGSWRRSSRHRRSGTGSSRTITGWWSSGLSYSTRGRSPRF